MAKDDEPKLKNKIVHRACIGNKVYESVMFNCFPKFLCFERNVGWSMEDEIEVGNERLLPMPKEALPYRPYVIDMDTFQQLCKGTYKIDKQELYDLCYDQIDTFVDAEEEDKVKIVSEIFETYIQFKLNSVGYLFILGDKDTGKSTMLDMIAFLGYRPLCGAAVTSANIYNYIGYEEENEGQVTILEDEIDPKNEKRDPDMRNRLKIYRTGYKKGRVVPKILDASSADRKQIFYRAFCSKGFAGRDFPKDEAFKSRCNTIEAVSGDPQKDEMAEEDKIEFDRIKLKFLIWRMMTFFDKLPEVDTSLKGRMKEIWKCKILSLLGTSGEETIKKIAQSDIIERKEQKKDSFEGKVLQATLDMCAIMGYGMPIPYKLIFKRLLKILDIHEGDYEDTMIKKGVYFVEGITTPISNVTVGRTLLSVFHGKKHLVKKEGRVYFFNEKTIQRFAKSYELEVSEDCK